MACLMAAIFSRSFSAKCFSRSRRRPLPAGHVREASRGDLRRALQIRARYAKLPGTAGRQIPTAAKIPAKKSASGRADSDSAIGLTPSARARTRAPARETKREFPPNGTLRERIWGSTGPWIGSMRAWRPRQSAVTVRRCGLLNPTAEPRSSSASRNISRRANKVANFSATWD